jgi:tetratricopeptide (TPR) repeat protein
VSSKRVEETDAILQELLSFDAAALGAADIAVVRNVLDLAGMLVATGRFGALEELYGKGIQVLSVHPQAVVSDSFVPLNNLGALYDKGGAYRQRDNIFSAIIARADALTAPIDERTARLFIELARFFESAGHTKPVAILYRHLQRFAISTPLDPEARRHLIHSYGNALAAEGQHQAALDMYRESLTAIEAASELADHDRMPFLFLMGGAARAAGDLAHELGGRQMTTAEKVQEGRCQDLRAGLDLVFKRLDCLGQKRHLGAR